MTLNNRISEIRRFICQMLTVPPIWSSSAHGRAPDVLPNLPQEIEPLFRAIERYRATILMLDQEELDELGSLFLTQVLNYRYGEDWRCTMMTLYELGVAESLRRAEERDRYRLVQTHRRAV